MFAKLTGVVDTYLEDGIVLDVAGVGYLVHCSSRTLQALPPAGSATSVHVETHVREDAIRLYGFRTDRERDWFRLLQTVQGVGAKVALAIQSVLDEGQLVTAVASGDKASLGRAPGVGPKLAVRILSELKDKVPAYAGVDPAVAGLSVLGGSAMPSHAVDAVSALVNLGYQSAQATAAVTTALGKAGPDPTAAVLIRAALRELSR